MTEPLETSPFADLPLKPEGLRIVDATPSPAVGRARGVAAGGVSPMRAAGLLTRRDGDPPSGDAPAARGAMPGPGAPVARRVETSPARGIPPAPEVAVGAERRTTPESSAAPMDLLAPGDSAEAPAETTPLAGAPAGGRSEGTPMPDEATPAADPTLGQAAVDAPAASREEDRETDRLLPWLRENFEAVVVAFIMALVIRCFCVEVFKIPTGSMQPTLMGHPEDGDRIMVNKFALHFAPVHRFDVVVFKYPLDTSRNFVKRAVGIGPEYFKLKEGDVYTRKLGEHRYRIAKKPLHVQESIWIDSYKSNLEIEHVRQHWYVTDEDHWTLGDDGIRLDATQTEDRKFTLTYNRDVRDYYAGGSGDHGGHNPVGDVKLTAAFAVESGTGGVTWHLFHEPYSFTVFLGVGGGSTLVYGNTMTAGEPQRVPIKEAALERGRSYVASVMCFDGTVYVMLDGRPVLEFDYLDEEDLSSGFGSLTHKLSLGARDAVVRLSRIEIQRDIYYLENGVLGQENPLEIPEGCYFMIGDNCPNSKDSRMWRRRWVRLTSGELIEGDADGETDSRNFVSESGNRMRIKDVHGVVHLVPEAAITVKDDVYHKFVRRDELVGKAFLVWWPPSRAKVIR